MAKNMSLTVSTTESFIYLDEADWQSKRATYEAIKLMRQAIDNNS
jgi:hypothetical protein